MSTVETPAANEAERKGVAAPSPSPAPTPAPTPAPSPAPYNARNQSRLPDGRVVDIHSTKSDPPSSKKPHGGITSEPLHEIPQEVDPLLVTILSWPRRHNSFSEFAFCKFLREHITQLGGKPLIMSEGCIVATVYPPLKREGNTDIVPSPSTTLFSCHVDTIEGTDADQPKPPANADGNNDGEPKVVRKKLTYDPNFGLIALDKDSIGGSLGADDGAGVWLMLKMIERKVPGTYVFHRGEELGGLGSKAMAEKYVELLQAYECAVAFDRHDTFEVIYHQGGMKCASLKFTEALCAKLNKQGMKYEPSTRGVFTDTKNYRKLIAECVNIAVGYQSQHGRSESLDYSHLAALLEAVCNMDWDSLPIDRDVTEPDYASYSGYQGGSYGGYGRGRGGDTLFTDYEDRDFTFPQGGSAKKKKGKNRKAGSLTMPRVPALTISEELSICSLEELETWATDKPYEAASALGQLLVEMAQVKASRDMLMKLMGWQEDNK